MAGSIKSYYKLTQIGSRFTVNRFYGYLFFVFLMISGFYINAQDNISSHQFKLVTGLDSLNLKTGDLLLFQSTTFNGKLIQIGTFSPYTHVAMVVKDSDGLLWLTHATSNIYNGVRIPVRFEVLARSGVILTRLEDSFMSIDGGKSGFYKRIWVRKFDESKGIRPVSSEVLSFYKKNKDIPFETSNYRFGLAAFDLRICGKDILTISDTTPLMCSEYLFLLLRNLNVPIEQKQAPNEQTPKDINRLVNGFYNKSITFWFKDGSYRMK